MAAVVGVDDAIHHVDRLLEAMRHRGPDGRGTVRTCNGVLGMNRLQVRPPSQLPLPLSLGSQRIAYNGEIYAVGPGSPMAKTVEDELAALFGERSAAMDGMWAAAWAEGPSLLLERDQWGERPLYYRKVAGGWAAASEASSLLRVFGRGAISEDAFVEMLALGTPVTTTTVYGDIHAVPPGVAVRLTPGSPEALAIPIDERYLPRIAGVGRPTTHALGDALEGSVARCVASERPIGLAVSGGLDSSLLADQMLRLKLPDIVTASVQVAGDEMGDLGRLAQALTPRMRALNWRQVSTAVEKYSYLDLLTQSVNAMGFPTRMSSVPLYLALAELAASNGIVVMLTGEGADELFLGYDSYRRYFDGTVAGGVDRLERVHLPVRRRVLLARLVGDRQVQRCRDTYRDMARPIGRRSPLRRLEHTLSLRPLLERADVCMMAYGIEGRAIYLHGDLPAYAEAFDDEELMVGGIGKMPLRRLGSARLDVSLQSAEKHPFRAPLRAWLTDCDAKWTAMVRARVRAASRTLDFCTRAADAIVDEAHYDDEAAALVGALLATETCEFLS